MQYYMLKEVCEINPSKQIDLSPDDKISFVPMDSVSVRGDIDTSKSISVSSIKTYSVFREGDVLFAKITPCMENGKGCIAHGLLNGYGAGSTEFIVLRPDSRLLMNKWLYYFLSQQNFRQECKQHMTGSAGQKRVPPKYLGSCSIPVPSISEQQRIVARIEELFSQLDDAEATLQKTKAQLALYRQAVLKDAFAFDSPKAPIRDISSIVTSGSRGWAKYYSDQGARFIRITDLTRDRIQLKSDDIQRVYLPDTIEGKRSRLKPNDVLVSITADLGSIAIIPDGIEEAYINQHIAMIRFTDQKQGLFMAWYLKSDYGQKDLLKNKRGNGKLGLGLDDIRKTQVPVVNDEFANKVVDAIDSRLSICDYIEQRIELVLSECKSMRQVILKRTIDGER